MTRFAGSRRDISDFLGMKTDFSGLGNAATNDAAQTSANTVMNNARASDARMSSLAKVQAAEHWADATKAAGQAQGQASMVGGIASGIGGLGGLFGGGGGGLGGGGGSSFGSSFNIGRAATY